MKTVAIMQPTYLPWMGYFALMDAVDEFIILDRVQFARRSWQQRNRIKTPQGPLMGELRQMLGIDTPLTFASDLPGAGAKADLLANLCVARGATHYVSPPGSRDYLESSQALDAAGVSLSYFDYEHPVHPQLHGEFLSHLSVIDLLFNTGPDALSILRSGIRT